MSASRLRRVLTTAGVTSALVALALPAQAATVSGAPSPSWGVYKPCPSSPKNNCAIVRSITHYGNDVYIGGDFTQVIDPTGRNAPLPYQNLVAINETTGQPDTTFMPHAFNGLIFSLAVSADGSRLYAGGMFSKVDGKAAYALHLAAFSTATGAKLAFKGAYRGVVRSLLATPLALYVGGSFTAVQGQPYAYAAKVDPVTGALDTGFRVTLTTGSATPSVLSFAVGTAPDGTPRLYLAGHFDAVNGVSQPSIAAVSPATGSFDNTFTPTVDAPAGDPLQAGDQVIAVGGNDPGVLLAQAGHFNRAYRFTLSGGRSWTFYPDGDVQAIAISGGTVYLGGHFVCAAYCYPPSASSVRRVHIAAVSYDGGVLDDTWTPSMVPVWSPYFYGVWALDVESNGDLWAGGVFRDVVANGIRYNEPKVAVFRAPVVA